MKFKNWYEKNYKNLLILSALILLISVTYVFIFYLETGDIIYKDVSLTGGTTITIFGNVSYDETKAYLSKKFDDFEIRSVSDGSGRQIELVITIKEEKSEELIKAIQEFLGYELNEENSSIETTSASLSEDFFKQLIIAVILAFFWMSAVVFLIFSKGFKIKSLVIILNLAFGFFLGSYFKMNFLLANFILFLFIAVLTYVYIRNSIPSFAVMLSAFSDIVITLAIVNFLGMKLSNAGIVAFLMLIGYSVDTDILLTTRVLKKNESINFALFESFKTGVTMTLTSIIAVLCALIVVYPFGTALNQIFTILLIGLSVDLFSTWITNASIIKWYFSKR